MAYHLTGRKALENAAMGKLTQLKSSQGIPKLVKEEIKIKDALGRELCIPAGLIYRITGTRDSNGYIITIPSMMSTHYLSAEVGCNLV